MRKLYGAWLLIAMLAACSDPEPAKPTADMAPDQGADMMADQAPDQAEDMAPDMMMAADPGACVVSEALVPKAQVQIGAWTLRLEGDGAWALLAPEGVEPVLRGARACEVDPADASRTRPALRVGTGAPFTQMAFGAWRFRTESGAMRWVANAGEPPVLEMVDGGGARLTWALADEGRSSASLTFTAADQRDLRVQLSSTLPGAKAGELQLVAGADEGFFGLGSQSYAMDLRGGKFPLWTQEQGIGKPEGGGAFPLSNVPEAAYAPMGVWHSSAGYTALVTSDGWGELDLAKTQADRVLYKSYPELPGMVLIGGMAPRERVQRLSDYVGRITQPAPWTFAPWNDAVGGPARVREVARVLRANAIPSSAIWVEDWIGGSQVGTGYRLSYAWEWDMTQYPDLPTLIDELHAGGFAFLAYFNTFVPQSTRMWTEGVEGGFLVKKASGELYEIRDPAARRAGLVDLSNPAARAWMKSYMVRAARDLKIDGWMADFTEWMPHDARLHSGLDGWLYHNKYPLDFQALNREVFEEVHATGDEAANNWVFFARSGWASANGGTGGLAATLWGGDQDTDWEYDDGLPTVLPIAAHVGLSGVPIFGSDIAGYSSFAAPNTNKELFMRWASLGALHPLMRTHHGSDKCGNWSFDRDAETLAHYKRWATLHTLLYPLWEALAAEAISFGLPITRHPFMVYPDKPALWRGQDYVFFIGDDVLVAPVLAKGATGREVELPEAGWWPLFGAAPVTQGTARDGVFVVQAEASATELPLYVRPGVALVLLAEAPDSFYGATQAGVTDLEDVRGRYTIALYPDARGMVGVTRAGAASLRMQRPLDGSTWAGATLDGQPLPPCAVLPPGQTSCADADQVIVRAASGTLVFGGAEFEIDGPTEQLYTVKLAGAAFGALAQPTLLTDLDPQIPPPCEQE
jgi:alpha-glucosidase (family GH31 glycosyl hydrolase)